MQERRILTLGAVVEIIATTVVNGESADDAIIAQVQRYVDEGWRVADDAKKEIAKHMQNACAGYA